MKKKTKTRASQVAYSWGILLAMLILPVLALMAKVFPQYLIVWQGLMAAAGLVTVRCVIGYLFASNESKAHSGDKHDAVTQA